MESTTGYFIETDEYENRMEGRIWRRRNEGSMVQARSVSAADRGLRGIVDHLQHPRLEDVRDIRRGDPSMRRLHLPGGLHRERRPVRGLRTEEDPQGHLPRIRHEPAGGPDVRAGDGAPGSGMGQGDVGCLLGRPRIVRTHPDRFVRGVSRGLPTRSTSSRDASDPPSWGRGWMRSSS